MLTTNSGCAGSMAVGAEVDTGRAQSWRSLHQGAAAAGFWYADTSIIGSDRVASCCFSLFNQCTQQSPVTRSDALQFLSGVSVWLIARFERLDALKANFGDEVDAVWSDVAGVVCITGCTLAMYVVLVEA